MKFSDIVEEQWEGLRPYLDTCVLPVTGMTGKEQPFEATKALERIRDVLDLIEIPFKGRVVTYPALHYIDDTLEVNMINQLCTSLKNTGFRHVIVISGINPQKLNAVNADLILYTNEHGNQDLTATNVSKLIQKMWNTELKS